MGQTYTVMQESGPGMDQTYTVMQEDGGPAEPDELGRLPLTTVFVYEPPVHRRKIITSLDVYGKAIEKIIISCALEDIDGADYATPQDSVMGMRICGAGFPAYKMDCGQLILLVRSDPSEKVRVVVHYRIPA